MALRIEVISDVICPWCFLGKRRLEKALTLSGQTAEVLWLPFQLNPNMPPEGLPRQVYRSAKFGSWERSQELDAQLQAAAAPDGLDFRFERIERTPNTLEAHRLIRLAGPFGVQDELVEALFRAYFQEGEDVGSPAVLERIAKQYGVTPFLTAGEGLAEVRAEERRARQSGISGVPAFFANGKPLALGAQASEILAEGLHQAAQQNQS